MNFKTLVEKVNLHVGLQGVVASVEATDYTAYLSEAVRSSWSDLQNQREDFKFMWEEVTFNTNVGVHEYSNSSIMTNAGNTFGVAKWKKGSIYKDEEKLTEIDWNYYREYESEILSEDSNIYVIKEYRDAGLILPTPTVSASIQAEFYRTPQILDKNTDIPLLPEEFHYLIVWKALEDVASYLGNPSIYERHSYKADILENKLMRSQVPSKAIKKKPIYRKRIGHQTYRSN